MKNGMEDKTRLTLEAEELNKLPKAQREIVAAHIRGIIQGIVIGSAIKTSSPAA